MVKIVPIGRLDTMDLNMFQCGAEQCKPGHYYGPALREHFLIHYIFDGKGMYQVGENKYYLSSGQGFLICPGIVTYYQADFERPWHYSWVGFHGLQAKNFLERANLTAESPIFTYRKDNFLKDCFMQMLDCKNMKKSSEIRLLGLLYLFLSQLIEENKQTQFFEGEINKENLYLNRIIEFIENNYSRKIHISEIAGYVGLNRSYMGAIFKEYFNVSPQDYLINFRIKKALNLMENPNLSIGEISRSVGYDDPFLFSKMFKKKKGMPPRLYRRKHIIFSENNL